MLLSDIGVYWLWFLLVTWWGLKLADKKSRHSLFVSLWEMFRVLWDAVLYKKEAEPIDVFFKDALAALLNSGFKDATAYVKPKYSKRRIEFRKYIRRAGDYGIELRFPSNRWATVYFEKVRTYCEARELPCRIETDTSRQHLCVDCGLDVDSAANLTRGIWTEVFGLPENAPRSYSRHGVSTWGELVDHPDQKWMTFEEGWSYLHPGAEVIPAVIEIDSLLGIPHGAMM